MSGTTGRSDPAADDGLRGAWPFRRVERCHLPPSCPCGSCRTPTGTESGTRRRLVPSPPRGHRRPGSRPPRRRRWVAFRPRRSGVGRRGLPDRPARPTRRTGRRRCLRTSRDRTLVRAARLAAAVGRGPRAEPAGGARRRAVARARLGCRLHARLVRSPRLVPEPVRRVRAPGLRVLARPRRRTGPPPRGVAVGVRRRVGGDRRPPRGQLSGRGDAGGRPRRGGRTTGRRRRPRSRCAHRASCSS